MSNLPPDARPTPDPAGGETVEVTPTAARGAVRTGRNIWILVISLGLVTVALIGLWLSQASHMATINHPQVRDMNASDAASFNTPAGSARQAPPSPQLDNHQ